MPILAPIPKLFITVTSLLMQIRAFTKIDPSEDIQKRGSEFFFANGIHVDYWVTHRADNEDTQCY